MEMSKTFQQIKTYAQRRGLPLIPIEAKDVSIINEPNVFYKTILDKINLISKRLALAALYIGTGSKEESLIKTIRDRKKHDNPLEVHIVLDANRATRKDSNDRSSLTILENLLSLDQVKLTLFKTLREAQPFIMRILSNYERINEISTTFHSKVLIFDNDVIITGANLNDTYFTNRQDRYFIINNSKKLSDYMYNYLKVIDKNQQQQKQQESARANSYTSIKNSIINYNQNYISNDIIDYGLDTDTFIIPVTQFGLDGLTDKEDFLMFIDSILPDNANVYMSSGYFNPSPAINKLNLNSIIFPSEAANGFFDGQGLSNYVPRLYTTIAKKYLDTHLACKCSVYNRPGWSFHAKGIWYENLDDICIHVFGSSNFNYRSSIRDFETQFILLTRNKNLIEKLQNERISIWKDSSRLDSNSFNDVNIFYKFLSMIFKPVL